MIADWFDDQMEALRQVEQADFEFGPETDAVRNLNRLAWYTTFAQAGRLRRVYDVLPVAERQMAETVAEYAARYVPGLGHAGQRRAVEFVARGARCALCGPDEEPPGREVWDSFRLATLALTVRPLIGSHGFTHRLYDVLTAPVRVAFGQVHPDDMVVT
jgi:hypothetical protein